jgi:anti-sigma factor ChrR (cupin superfamily)
MAWTASPSGTVWRKRMHRVGPAESGQVTSIVRYEPDSAFPSHDHPDGEEILVLEGIFSDEHGDWSAGTYLLNPEGFRHAPFSREGCVIFVKLRQYPGRDRLQQQLPVDSLPWTSTGQPGRAVRQLYAQEGYSDTMRLERWEPAADKVELTWPDGVELYVVNGAFDDELGHYAAGSWLRLPPGSRQLTGTASGVELYIKEGGFAYLQAG